MSDHSGCRAGHPHLHGAQQPKPHPRGGAGVWRNLRTDVPRVDTALKPVFVVVEKGPEAPCTSRRGRVLPKALLTRRRSSQLSLGDPLACPHWLLWLGD